MKRVNILLLDDEKLIIDLLDDMLSEKFNIRRACNGFSALEIIKEYPIDLVLVDYNLPDMNGLDFISKARELQPDTVYIIVSGNRDMTIAIDAVNTGVWHFIQKPFKDVNYIKKVIDDTLEKRNLILLNRRYREDLESMVKQRTLELEKKNAELIQSRTRIIGILSRAAEFKDYETGQHFIRVSRYSGLISSGLNLAPLKTKIIEQAAPVHDIGKIGIPERILLKKGKLNAIEYEEMKKHCLFGEEILRSQSLDEMMTHDVEKHYEGITYPDELLATAARIAKSHHERVDGSGYPCGLKGEKIPLEARIVAVADVYDALGSERHYKESWTETECRAFIRNNSGILFDPDVVDAFLKNIDSIMEVKMQYMDNQFMHTTA